MKHFLIGFGLCLISVAACAGERVNETRKASSNGYVEIEHLNGRAQVRGWDRDEVKVSGELGEYTEEFIFERDGNEVLIKVEVRKNKSGWGNWGSDEGDDLEIFVPKNSRVNYTSTNANLEIEDVFGGADVDVVNGDINAKSLKGRIRLEAVNGEIRSRELSGDIKIETVNGDIDDQSSSDKESRYETVNGDIQVRSDSTDVNAETVNGDIELYLSKVDELQVNTVNGSIDARLELAPQGDVRASTVGGSVTLAFKAGVSARFDIQAHAGGKIINDLTSDKVQKAKYGPNRWLEFSMNGGEGKVDISTVSGRIKLEKQ